MRISDHYRRSLSLLLACVVALTLVGLIFIYSASSVFALERFGSAHYFVKKQIGGTTLGILSMLLSAHLPLRLIHFATPFAYVVTLLLTALPLLIPAYATTIHGSSRWLTIGPVTGQPIEFLKITYVLMLAFLMSREQFAQTTFWRNLLSISCVALPAVVILLMQPDFGQTALIIGTLCAMFAVAHPDLGPLMISIASACCIGIGLIVAKPYRLKRIMTFLYPWDDPYGSGFQIIQSLIAIGSGGKTGIGLAHSQQKFFYLPMQHTDFIFSIIAEETGFIGSIVLIALFAVLLYSGIRLAWHARTTFTMLTSFGYISMISLQTCINLAVTTGLAPTKGIGLPFVSYGLSSLLAHYCMIGIMIACTREQK